LFRPRRKGRTLQSSGTYFFELKALAIREQKTYVLHKPDLADHSVSIYLDFEGVNSIYLAGGLIEHEGKFVEPFSFWADYENEGKQIFQHLFDLFTKYSEAVIYYYGS